MKRSPLRPRRREPRRTAQRLEHGLPWDVVRTIVWARSGGRCEVCSLPMVAMDGHHRLTRRYGPDCPCNVLALHPDCHHGRVHGEPVEAREHGWILSRHFTGEPGDQPVWLRGVRGRDVYLTCEGTYRLGLT